MNLANRILLKAGAQQLMRRTMRISKVNEIEALAIMWTNSPSFNKLCFEDWLMVKCGFSSKDIVSQNFKEV